MTTTLSKSIEYVNQLIDKHNFQKPLIIGISGPQGSGKSYLAEHLTRELKQNQLDKNIIQFSIDDYYLPKVEQDKVNATSDNVLLHGRGLPGTHDLQLLNDTFDQILNSSTWEPLKIPIYDKSAFNGLGDRSETYQLVDKPIDIVIFEGWFLGYSPVDQQQLTVQYFTNPDLQIHKLFNLQSVNTNLEKYQEIWNYINSYIIINTDDIANVFKWRLEQEHNLIKTKGVGMSDLEVKQFINRYMPLYILYYKSFVANASSDLVLNINLYRSVE